MRAIIDHASIFQEIILKRKCNSAMPEYIQGVSPQCILCQGSKPKKDSR